MSFELDDRFAWFLEQFGEPEKIKTVDESSIQKYKGKLPEQLLNYWQEFGFCRFQNGLFSIVNPDDYAPLMQLWLKDTDILEQDNYHVIAKTGFGDLMLWGKENGNSYNIEAKDGVIFMEGGDKKRIASGKENLAMQGFFAVLAPDEIDLEDVDTNKPIFADAVKKFGPLAPDEMFTFEPALFLGGEQTLKTVKKVNLFVQLEILGKMGTPQVMDIHGLAKKAFS